MRTIYINGRFLRAKLSGIPRHGRGLLRALDNLLGVGHSDLHFVVLVPKNVVMPPIYKRLTVRTVGRLTGHAWEQFELPFYARDGVLFSPSGSAPIFHPRNVLTIHDAIVFAKPAGFARTYIVWYRLLSLILCRTAMQITTVSQFSKRELLRWCHAKPQKICVIYPGAQHMLEVPANNEILELYDLQRFSYVLAVGSSSPNKNLGRLIEAMPYFENKTMRVVIVGQTGATVGQHGTRASSLKTAGVKTLGHVTDSELRSLYENAGCFVFPSLYEGFGLPPLEALSLGCPIVIADAASLPEVCGSAALLCDPYDPRDIARQIHLAVQQREDPSNAKRNALFAAQYTFDRCARETWALLETMAEADHK